MNNSFYLSGLNNMELGLDEPNLSQIELVSDIFTNICGWY